MLCDNHKHLLDDLGCWVCRAQFSEARQEDTERKSDVNLQSICDRLNDVFNEDDTPDHLSQNAAFTIEMLWQQRDDEKARADRLQEEVERLKEAYTEDIEDWKANYGGLRQENASQRATIERLEQEAADDLLAFNHANDVIGKQEATIEGLQAEVKRIKTCNDFAIAALTDRDNQTTRQQQTIEALVGALERGHYEYGYQVSDTTENGEHSGQWIWFLTDEQHLKQVEKEMPSHFRIRYVLDIDYNVARDALAQAKSVIEEKK